MQDEVYGNGSADAHTNFMQSFVRRGERRKCFYAPNTQEFLNKLQTVMKNDQEMDEESNNGAMNPEETS